MVYKAQFSSKLFKSHAFDERINKFIKGPVIQIVFAYFKERELLELQRVCKKFYLVDIPNVITSAELPASTDWNMNRAAVKIMLATEPYHRRVNKMKEYQDSN